MAYLKPQSPIKFQEDHIYPLTTADQVILEDGSRWDGGAEANEKIENAQSMANDALSKAEDALSKVDNLDASDVNAAPASHTHNYAGSDSVGGAANSLSLPKGVYDLNTMHVDGGDVVAVEANSASTNLPEAQWYYVQSFMGTDNYGHQIAYRESANEIWHRNLVGGTWGAWQKIYDTGNKPTYSDVGAAAASHSHTHSDISGCMLANKIGKHDCNTIYNAEYTSIQHGSNCPSGNQYGSLLTLPYRTMTGNTSSDFSNQIFLPNGDDPKDPDGMYYRTSVKTNWRSWNRVWTNNNLKFTLEGSTLKITST